MLNTIGYSLSDLASSDDEEDLDDVEDVQDTVLSKLSEDNDPGCVMGTISKMVHHHMENFWPKPM